MDRLLLLAILCCTTICSYAQEEKQVTVVKPGTVEMKAVSERPAGVIILPPATATGNFEFPPSHPECTTKEGQEVLDCTAAQVLKVVKEKMGEPSLNMEQWGTSPVSINFSIDQFGAVKDARVEHSIDKELHKRVIIALYDLPTFQAAKTAEGKAVASSMQMNYRYEEFFE